MHVHMNSFDYDKLLTGLIHYHDLGDEEITSDAVEKIFTDLGEKFKRNSDIVMQDNEVKMCEDFLKSLISYENFDIGDDESFVEVLGEAVNEGMSALFEALGDDFKITRFNHFIITHVLPLTEFDFDSPDDGEMLDQFSEYFTSLIDDYITMTNRRDFSPAEMFILGQIEQVTKAEEIVIDIEVISVPGKKVKYRDTLITFPIILIEVTEQ